MCAITTKLRIALLSVVFDFIFFTNAPAQDQLPASAKIYLLKPFVLPQAPCCRVCEEKILQTLYRMYLPKTHVKIYQKMYLYQTRLLILAKWHNSLSPVAHLQVSAALFDINTFFGIFLHGF